MSNDYSTKLENLLDKLWFDTGIIGLSIREQEKIEGIAREIYTLGMNTGKEQEKKNTTLALDRAGEIIAWLAAWIEERS